MKRLPCLLLLLALAMAALTLAGSFFPTGFSTLAAFPFEQLSALLRSLTGTGGACLGWAILAVCAALPLIPVLRHGFAPPYRAESAALGVCAAVTPAAVYLMANPALLLRRLPASDPAMLPVLYAILGGTVWSGAVVWGILRLLRHFRHSGREPLQAALRLMLYALCVLFTAAASTGSTETLLAGFAAASLPADRPMTILRAAAAALPYALDVAVTMAALRLLDALISGEDVTASLASLTRRCTASLAIVTVTTASINLIHLLLIGMLSDLRAALNIPVVSLAFVLFTLLFARLIAENRVLQDVNATLQDENTALQDENTTLQDENTALQDENTALQDENTALQDENTALQDENARVQGENDLFI